MADDIDTPPASDKRRYDAVPEWRQNMPKGTIGEVHEMLVSYDLLKKGWLVFRSVTRSSAYKIIAIKGDVEIKIEVTTGHRFGDVLHHPKKGSGPWDVLAIVVKDDEIIYQARSEKGLISLRGITDD